MQTRFLTWAQGLYVAALALGLIFIIPSAWFPLQVGKLATVLVCLCLSVVFFALSGSARVLLRGRTLLLIALGALLPLCYLLSYLFSTDKSVGLSGFSIEADTVLFVFVGFLVYALAVCLFRTVWSARILLSGVVVSALVVGIFQYLVIIFGTSLLPSMFSDRSINLVGKWNDLGLLISLVLMLTLFAVEQGELSMRRKVGAVVIGLASLLLLAIIHFPLTWSMLLVFCVALALWSFVAKRAAEQRGLARVPWLPVVGALVFGIFLLWGSVVNSNLTNPNSIFPVSSLEVRPSFASTLGIIKASHGPSIKRFLIGSGPETFGNQWLMYKPMSVNQSQFWNLDFNVGFSSFMTSVGTVGLLGALAWLVPLLLVVISLVATMRSGRVPRERMLALGLGLGALWIWAAVLFYVPSEGLVLVGFAFTGALLGLLFNRASDEAPSELRISYPSLAAALVLAVCFFGSTYFVARRAMAESYTNQGLIALGQTRADDALALAARSQALEQNGDNLRLAADAGTLKLQQLAANEQHPTQQQITDFANQAGRTIPSAQAAVALNGQDYRAYLSLAKVYDLLASLGVSGAYANAKAAYVQAAAHNPTNPQIPLLMARLEAGQGNLAAVQADLTQSLTLKPDYTDAMLFVVQLNIAAKDIPSAIKAAQAAVQSAPGVPSIWFELGLLYYSENDTQDAIPVLEQAVKLESDYANAKYFLGLSYAAQGRTQDAVAQFSDLAKSNPDNQEVRLILGNLQSGKQPFAGAQPPVTSTPQTREQAPISQ